MSLIKCPECGANLTQEMLDVNLCRKSKTIN